MGFNINETIETKLHYKDISLIAVALGEYQERYKNSAEPEILKRAKDIVNRLGNEMSNFPQDKNRTN